MLHYAANLKADGFDAKPIVVCEKCVEKAQDDPNVEIDATDQPVSISSKVSFCHYSHEM